MGSERHPGDGTSEWRETFLNLKSFEKIKIRVSQIHFGYVSLSV